MTDQIDVPTTAHDLFTFLEVVLTSLQYGLAAANGTAGADKQAMMLCGFCPALLLHRLQSTFINSMYM